MLLLLGSCYFYMCFIPVYILILGFTIGIDYVAGIFIETSKGRRRKYLLLASLIANIGVLAVFKYYNFINGNITVLLHGLHYHNPIPYLSVLLPIGLSFHTFQAMSYTIEVYRGNQKAERNFGIYSLYVMFFPQLVAGPIERPQHLIHQFKENHIFDYQRITDGLRLMLWGFFKKIVIADRLAIMVNQVYDNPTHYEGFPLMLATVLFAFQIFCDFSGYSDIAIGAAKILGFRLMTNFNKPYFSTSVSEFWKRWHISLSTWFKDYLYITLGGNRVTIPRWYLNILIVFLVSGLWHGASWTFVIWGALHGSYLILNVLVEKPLQRFYQLSRLNKVPLIKKTLQIFCTFCLVAFAWIFFRAKSVTDASYIVTHLFKGTWTNIGDILSNNADARSKLLYLGMGYKTIVIALLSILFMESIHIIQARNSISEIFQRKPAWARWLAYYIVIVTILFFGVFEHSQQFIYFQF